MKKLTGNQVRQMFLDYFTMKGHMIEPGVSLVPVNDPTLLWINSGVAALKKYLDGREKPACNRICNAQKCIRTNDIENVGKTARHHTFFEMLGNWSIGDYFKEESLKMSWEFLTSPDWMGFDPEKIYVTIYPDDKESYRIWTEVNKINPNHILKSYDNFWEIGEGPSGPDSEIYYDRGPKYDPQGLGEKLFFEEMENDRYVELWNNVFSQYDAKEGVDRKDYKELPQKNIDTGMGLERLVALIQDGETNFDTDLFLPIIYEVEKYANVKYADNKMAFRVIADHIRTCVFALSDGASFSNEGRGYVLRRVLRRAMRYARNIGINKPFLFELVDVVCENMKDFYPYLLDKKEFVKKLIKKEEEAFINTLANGEKLLKQELEKDGIKELKGEIIFKLYDTYGFPKEMTIESAEEKGIKCDIEGFNKCMEKQKELARNARNEEESMHNQSKDLLDFTKPSSFIGYESTYCNSKAIGLFENGVIVNEIKEEGDIIFDKTPFYATSGGQIADNGFITKTNVKAYVNDVIKAPNGQFLHHVKVNEGTLKIDEEYDLQIDEKARLLIRANHSSLHLLQSALRNVLGSHIAQAGSYVCKDYARFDFSHFEKISNDDLKKIESLVNDYIQNSYPINTEVLSISEAKKTNAIALFDEKYGDTVRVVSMGEVSKEFCGGTHASNTADLNLFKIVSEESVGSGIRRIEVVTKQKAYELVNSYENKLNDIKDYLGLKNIDLISDRLIQLDKERNEMTIELKKYKDKLMSQEADSLINNAKTNGKYKYILLQIENYQGMLKDYANNIRNKLDGGFVFVLNKNENGYSFVASCGDKAINNGVDANKIIKEISTKFNGKGGGKPDCAQGGAQNDVSANDIIKAVESMII